MPEQPMTKPGPPLIPTDGMVITRDTIFAPGVYLLPEGISIAADEVTLDGNGALLVGRGREGRGLSIAGRSNVTVKNLQLQGYYYGMYAHGCRALTIAACRASGTAEVPP